jgi:GNAT superfamily N-acetyltransferase
MEMESSASARSADMRIRLAAEDDAEPLAGLINAAFVVEREIFEGARTSPDGVRTYMQSGKFLLAEDAGGLAGCVYVELRGDRGYVGLLSVDPSRQGSGLGRKLMDAAEQYFREAGCTAVDLRVVSAREPLPGFYRHLGYVESHVAPITSGAPVKVPCHYIYFSKTLI